MTTDASPRVTLLLGSAPDVTRCASWPKRAFGDIIAINNAWRVRPDWDVLVHAGDFPSDRMPPRMAPGAEIVTAAQYVPAQNSFGGFVYAGGTMSMTAGYWAVHSRRPGVLAFLGCDMIYDGPGDTHFYGIGRADPLRDDVTLQSLEAKSARLLVHALRQGTLCVNLSDLPRSRLVFPKMGFEELRERSPSDLAAMKAELRASLDLDAVDVAERLEDEFGYFYEDGMYWRRLHEIDGARLARIDRLWLAAAGGLAAPPLEACDAAE